MKLLSRLQARVIVAAGCFITASANADTTYAEAYTAVSGIPTVLNTDVGGASGANAYAIIPLQNVAVSSTAKSSVGSLHV